MKFSHYINTNFPRQAQALRSEHGIALVMVLILSAIALGVTALLLYMVTIGTQVSGSQKRYHSAIEAGIGGVDITYQMLAARGDPGIPGIGFAINPSIGTCLTTKLNSPTSAWGACNSSLLIDPAGIADSFDTSFTLEGPDAGTTYTVYTKIVDTVEGNSGGDIGLTKSGVVNTNSGEVSVVSIPYLYTLEVDVENAANRNERAKLSVLYQY